MTYMQHIRDEAPHSLLGQMLTTKEAARYVGVNVNTFAGYCNLGVGPQRYRLKHTYFYKRDELDQWKAGRA